MLLRSRPHPRRAVVLLAVLVVVVLLSLAAYKYTDWMQAEYRAADSGIRASQAKAFALSGVHYTAAILAGNIDNTLGGNPWDNSNSFSNIEVPSTSKSARTGRFSIISLRSPEEAGSGNAYRFGVTDEGGKINVNGLLALDRGKGEVGKKILMGLPGMTDETANAILDWIDPDETPRQGGAENETYSTMSPPYKCKNGPLDSLEELLLVRGVTPQLLFGSDKNRNGSVDADEDGGVDGSGQGWAAYLTVYSREVNLDSTGAPRVNVNDQDLTMLKDKVIQAVGDDLGWYIIAYRLYGGSAISTGASGSGSSGSGSSSGSGGSGGSTPNKGGGGSSSSSSSSSTTGDISSVQSQIDMDLSKNMGKGKGRLRSLWDLVNSQVSVKVGEGRMQKTIVVPSPLNEAGQQRELLPKLLDTCTTKKAMDLPARININTAPAAVLAGLMEVANLQDSDIQNIISKRPQPSDTGATDEVYKSTAWLLTELNLPASTLKKLDPYITGRTQVYRFQSVGYYDKGGPIARVEAVVDTNQGRPRIVYWRDLSELGKGFDLKPAGD